MRVRRIRSLGLRTYIVALSVFVGATFLVPAPAEAAPVRYLDEVFTCNTWNSSGSGSSCRENIDIVYGQAFDEFNTGQLIDLKLDRRSPPSSDSVTNRPALIWAHGGGGANGDKVNEAFLMQEWTRRGFVTASINYRLCPSCQIPIMNETVLLNAKYDMQMAVRYVRNNAAAWGIDPNRIIVAGFSFGASMTYGTVYDSVDDNDAGPTSSAVAAGIMEGPGSPGDTFLHRADPGEPPIAIFVGVNDGPTGGNGYFTAGLIYSHLHSKGIFAEFSAYPLGTHSLHQLQDPTIWYGQDFLERSSDFLYRRLPLDAAITAATPQAFITRTDMRFATNTNGNPSPPAKTISIVNVGGGTLSWTASSIPAGVTVTPASGSGLQRGESSLVSIQANPTGPGTEGQTYSAGDITIDTPGAAVATHAVTVFVKATDHPAIQLQGRELAFGTNSSGLPAPAAQTVSVENVGGGTLNWIVNDSPSWISESNLTGTTLGPGGTGSFQVSATPASETTCRIPGVEQTCGPYSITVAESPPSVPPVVSQTTSVLVTYADRSRILASPAVLWHYLPANGQTGTTSRNLTLMNIWGGTLAWQAQMSCPGAVVVLTPSSGTLTSNQMQSIEVRITWNPGTTVGAYGSCLTTINDNGSLPPAVWPSETVASWAVAT